MRAASPPHLRHTGYAQFHDPATGTQVIVELSVYADEAGAWTVCRRDDGTLNSFEMPLADLHWWRSFLFPSAPTGIRSPVPTPTLAAVPDLSDGRRAVRTRWCAKVHDASDSCAAD